MIKIDVLLLLYYCGFCGGISEHYIKRLVNPRGTLVTTLHKDIDGSI